MTQTTRNMTVTVRGQQVSFVSSMSDNEAVARLNALLHTRKVTSTFAYDICNKALAGQKLSPVQFAWIHKIVLDNENPQPRPEAPKGKLTALVALFDKAADHLKRPAIELEIEGTVLRMSRCTEASKYPGCINITDGTGYGGKWFGRVERDGSVTAGRDLTPAVTALLEEFAKDPAATACKHGRLNGRCAFCGRKLEDERSTAVGYGPVCAGHYGLPWGDTKTNLPSMLFTPVAA